MALAIVARATRSVSSSSQRTTRRCPSCAEPLAAATRKCPTCGEWKAGSAPARPTSRARRFDRRLLAEAFLREAPLGPLAAFARDLGVALRDDARVQVQVADAGARRGQPARSSSSSARSSWWHASTHRSACR